MHFRTLARWGTSLLVVALSLAFHARAHAQRSLVFVDDGVPEADVLAQRVRAGHEVVRLDATADRFAQIGRALATRRDLSAVTIMSHGAPGALMLGDQRVDAGALASRADEVRAWGAALAAGADLVLYGCRVGAGDEGAAFVSRLASLTGADVAASTDATGPDEGDWTLERRVGDVEASAPWAPSVLARWHHLLTTYTEPPDLANNIGAATTIVLTSGANTVSGSVATPSDGQDNFLVQVPTGMTLTAVSLTLNTSGGFSGSVTFNLNENRTTSGAFTVGLPLGPGSYYVQVIANFSIGNAWSMSFTVASAAPVCGNGLVEGTEQCDDGNSTQCDGCSNTCTTVINGCFIGGTCIAEGSLNPANQCASCQRAISRTTYSPLPSGAACDDGQFCTVSDACNGAGVCASSARNCADALSCTTDSCNETFDRCDHPVTTGCLIGGACIAEGALNPANACTRCSAAASTTTYTSTPSGSACDDGMFCTVGDACNGAGSCASSARNCADALSCTTDSCNEAMDMCLHPLAMGCLIGGACIPDGTPDPTNPCMRCNAATSTTAYTPTPSGVTCNDGQFCTVSDACNGTGSCTGSARSCADALSCTTDSCDEAGDACTHPVTSGCLIGGACIADGTADPSNACMRCSAASSTSSYTPAPATTSCDDGQFCTVSDACDGSGTCGGSARSCADTLSCTTDACDEAADTCTNTLSTGCLIGGACIADGAVDPSNDCQVCTPATSTSAYSAAASGTSCDDALFCTTGDACDGSGTCTGTARDCSDGLACTTDACDEAGGTCTSTVIAGCGDAGTDAAVAGDAGVDGGATTDGGTTSDGGAMRDSGAASDGGARPDARVTADGSTADGSTGDAGTAPMSAGGCGCRVGGTSSPAPVAGLLAVLALAWLRRRAR